VPNSLTAAAKANITGLLLAAAGIVIQIISGVHYPKVPPGLIMLLVAAGLVAFARWPWGTVVGVIVPLFLLIGGVISETGRHDITTPGHVGAFTGTLVQAAGVVLALAAGLAALSGPRRRAA
jgi:hypothetical protein